ncbi:MAG: serine hydrolase [SAR202 cluster bacterium]|jgi:beta-lactamase class A|nr:serine hydrolase [SAR202 cluster bacterium]MDP6513077.1 serine hydrolase [SAR202 cluster bacterium]MDP6713579.1 serine hydrolase [SAR202 cluster bacterium]
MNNIDEAISKVNGSVGVAAKHLDTGQEINRDAHDIFFTASTLKVPLIVALYRLVDESKIDPSERIDFADSMRVPGSSILKVLGSGLNPTIHDLAMLMIIVSDNTATDLIFERVGKDRLEATIAEMGLANTRIPMTTLELLYSIVGLDPADNSVSYEQASRMLRDQQLVLDADGFQEDKSDVSTPSDMSKILEIIHSGDFLSDSSREAVLNILRSQQLNNVIPLLLPLGTTSAHKTGSYHGVRCDVGIVYGESGPYTIALMAKGVSGISLETDLSLARISKAIYDEFNPNA